MDMATHQYFCSHQVQQEDQQQLRLRSRARDQATGDLDQQQRLRSRHRDRYRDRGQATGHHEKQLRLLSRERDDLLYGGTIRENIGGESETESPANEFKESAGKAIMEVGVAQICVHAHVRPEMRMKVIS